MSNKKLRVGGMTVQANETYSGKVVLQLLETSFENGRRQGELRCCEEFARGYNAGVNEGKERASEQLKNLKEALRDILG